MSIVTVTVLSDGAPISAEHEILSLEIIKEVNRIPFAQLIFLDGDVPKQHFALSDETLFVPGTSVEIRLRYEQDDSDEFSVFSGVVTKHRLIANPKSTQLSVELKDIVIGLTTPRRSTIYTQLTDSKLIQDILNRRNIQIGDIMTTAFQHTQIVQYQASDWDFMLSRADSNGLLIIAEDGIVSAIEPKLENARVTHTFTFGIDNIFDFEIEIDAERQYPEVQTFAWDVKKQKATKPLTAVASDLPQGNLDSVEIAQSIGAEAYKLGTSVQLANEEIQSWADTTLQRSRMAFIRGRLTVEGLGDINLLDAIEITGIGERVNGKALITGIRHTLSLHGWQTDIQFGLSPTLFSEGNNMSEKPANGLLPAVYGLHIGVIDQFKDDPDQMYRVRVKLPGLGEEQSYLWARLATPDAGADRGIFFFPEQGDEVVVGFFNNDPRQPVIIGSMFSSKNKLPEMIDTITTSKAIVTKSGVLIGLDDENGVLTIKTPTENTIELSDEDKQIVLKDQHGNSITLNSSGIEIDSTGDVLIKASGNVDIK